METWESHVLCEISKALWKPICGFHSDDISTAAHAVSPSAPRPCDGGGGRATPA